MQERCKGCFWQGSGTAIVASASQCGLRVTL